MTPATTVEEEKAAYRVKGRFSTLVALIYFFFNGTALPFGLLYTQLLAPVFYVRMLIEKRKPILLPLLLVLIPFDIAHMLIGVDIKSFLVSNTMFVLTFISVRAFAAYIQKSSDLHKLFYQILLINIAFTGIALLIYFTPFRDLLWYKNKFTHSVNTFYRLSLLTYEASYYSLLLTPIVFYFLLKIFLGQITRSRFTILLMVLIPMGLSLSIGVIAAMVFAFLMLYLVHWEKIFSHKSFFIPLLFSVVCIFSVTFILALFFPDNPLFIRLHNIFLGIDTSTNGRTTDSWTLAYLLAKSKNLLFGCGLGQIKIIANDIVRTRFWYWGNLEVVRIPNAMGETLAMFGILGVFLRLGLIGYFFLKTKVWTNYFRTLLFSFIFLYQFTGSFITNIVEYTAWIFAFVNCFPEFDVNPKNKRESSIHYPA